MAFWSLQLDSAGLGHFQEGGMLKKERWSGDIPSQIWANEMLLLSSLTILYDLMNMGIWFR